MNHNEYVKAWRKTESGKRSVAEYRKRSAEKRKQYSFDYYQKNRDAILAKTAQRTAENPQWRETTKTRNRTSGKGVTKGRTERVQLKDSYIKALIIQEGSEKSIDQKKREVLQYRIRKALRRLKKSGL